MILQMAPMWVLAGLSGGWLAENFLTKGSYGLMIDMALALGGSVAAGYIVLVLTGDALGMLGMFALGLIAAGGVIIAQRWCWRSAS
jgi:hypothetical protein